MGFSPKTISRSWLVTIHIANMQKAELSKAEYERPEVVADFFISQWENSGKGRIAAITVCLSAENLYHAHMACYGNSTTLKRVSSILFDAHVEPQLAGKQALKDYLLKEGKYAEKGEIILYQRNIDLIQDNTGNRSDLEVIEEMLNSGSTPAQILSHSFSFYRYEKMIKSAYLAKRIQDTPSIKDMYCEFHFGRSGTGKTFTFHQLCEKYGINDVYLINDYANASTGGGGFDYYMNQPAKIIFLDEYRGQYPYSTLLSILSSASRSQMRCRYTNIYHLWTSVYISSIYSLEEIYEMSVPEEKRKIDTFFQLKRRIHTIVYHYQNSYGEFKTFSMKAEDYIDKYHMIKLAREAEQAELEARKASLQREEDLELEALSKALSDKDNKNSYVSAEEALAAFGCKEAIPINK